ncbi:hypothetical protein Ahy_B04g070787 [Arachis hypogaea]|uniref:Protein FAR1-RELATED SEQUENCE n=1 Tax=Arachis hypogaea TaxID=3818 RepID=A0A444ZJK7_ARAHY|nr:hypothetical protein Ahy_B04g070787 [Arachis hypogaea]
MGRFPLIKLSALRTHLQCCHTLAVWSYYRVDTVLSCYVLPRWSKNVIRKHTYIKSSHDVAWSDESNNLFRHLCLEFYNVAQEFFTCDEEEAILRAALWDTKSKLTDYRASVRSTTVVVIQNTMPTQSTGSAIVHDIQGPSRVKTKGRPKSKRLGAELDKSIKKLLQKRKRKSHPDDVDRKSDNDHHGSVNKRFEDSTIWNSSDGGGFMHLLNSLLSIYSEVSWHEFGVIRYIQLNKLFPFLFCHLHLSLMSLKNSNLFLMMNKYY